jgi:HlyD family secretion protein
MINHKIGLIAMGIGALALASCGTGQTETTTPSPSPAGQAFTPVVSASGQVVPKTWASLSLPSGGVIGSVAVAEGDEVGEGKILLQLTGREQLEAALAAAELEETSARIALNQVYDDEAVARAAAQSELATARDEVRKADYNWTVQQEGNRASNDTIKKAKANLVVAEAAADRAKRAYDKTPGKASEDGGKAAAQAAYLAAKAAVDSARRSLNWYTGHPTDIQQAMLDADLAVAKARLAKAQQVWDSMQDGPDPDVLSMAQSRLKQARANVDAAQAALRDSQLTAPFGGTIGSVHARAHEWANPGAPLVEMANLDEMQVETTDLSEIDAARVDVGAPVKITFDALPGVEVDGHVVRLAPKASAGSGVNYTAWISIDDVPDHLLWGMTAFVDIDTTR